METQEQNMTAAPIPEALMEEHRQALARMRRDFALEQLYQSSGARDPSLLPKLIDIEEGDVTFGEDGIPDVRAVKAKIDGLRRDRAYLFADPAPAAAHAAPAANAASAAPAVRLGALTQTDPDDMDDNTYYRTVMASGRGRRR